MGTGHCRQNYCLESDLSERNSHFNSMKANFKNGLLESSASFICSRHYITINITSGGIKNWVIIIRESCRLLDLGKRQHKLLYTNMSSVSSEQQVQLVLKEERKTVTLLRCSNQQGEIKLAKQPKDKDQQEKLSRISERLIWFPMTLKCTVEFFVSSHPTWLAAAKQVMRNQPIFKLMHTAEFWGFNEKKSFKHCKLISLSVSCLFTPQLSAPHYFAAITAI